MLCDAATVREGLLNVIGGGISQTTLPAFPGSVQFQVALRVVFEGDELKREPHELQVTLTDPDGGELERLRAEFQVGRVEGWPLDEAAVALPLVIATELSKPGTYQIEATIDGNQLVSLPLDVREAPGAE